MTLFQPGDLRRQVESVLSVVPDEKRGAVVAYWTTDGHCRVVVATRLGEGWQMGGYFDRDVQDGKVDYEAGVVVRGTW